MDNILNKENTTVGFKEFDIAMGRVGNTFDKVGDSLTKILEAQQNTNKQIGTLTTQMTMMRDDFDKFDQRITRLETIEEVTTEQSERIRIAACNRVYSILGNDLCDRQKYFRTFISHLYSDAKKSSGLGYKISTTKKGNYQRVLDYIESWNPSGGASKLKKEIDKIAEARRIVRSKGYM